MVRNLNLTVGEGEVVCLLGANGAGKTTTLLTIAGALPVLGGEVEVLGATVAKARPHEVARRGPGHRAGGPRPVLQADRRREPAAAPPPRSRRSTSRASSGTSRRCKSMLRRAAAGLLSGGEQQMLALAGALIADPKVVMLDEMSLGLAPIIVEQLLPTVRQIADERGMAVLLVEQHVLAALKVADRGYVLAHGEVVAEGDSAELRKDAELLEASYLGDESAVQAAEASGLL